MAENGELTSNAGEECDPTSLVVSETAYMGLYDPTQDGLRVTWHWLKPVPKT